MFTKEAFVQDLETEAFTDFLAKKETAMDGTTIIDWQSKTGSGVNSIRFLLSGHSLVVTGDLGDAVFTLTEPARLDRIAGYHTDYLMSKLSCGSASYRFDRDLAFQALDEQKAEYAEAQPEHQEDMHEVCELLKEQFSTTDGFVHLGAARAVTEFCKLMDDGLEWLESAGRIIAPKVYMWHTAIRMAWKQLSAKEQAGRYLAARLCQAGRMATQIQTLDKQLNRLLSELEEDDEVLSPDVICTQSMRVVDGIIDEDGNLSVYAQTGKPASLLGRKRQFAYRYEDSEQNKDKPAPSDCVPYFVDQRVGYCEDDFYGTMYFILDRVGEKGKPEQAGPCKVLACPYEC